MQDKIELENKVMNFLKELIITNTYVKKIIIDNIQEDILNFFKKIKPEETTVQLSKNNIDKNIYFKNGIVIINTFNINIKNYDEYSNSASLCNPPRGKPHGF